MILVCMVNIHRVACVTFQLMNELLFEFSFATDWHFRWRLKVFTFCSLQA